MPDFPMKRLSVLAIILCGVWTAGLAWSETRNAAARNGAVDRSVRPADDFYGYANGV